MFQYPNPQGSVLRHFYYNPLHGDHVEVKTQGLQGYWGFWREDIADQGHTKVECRGTLSLHHREPSLASGPYEILMKSRIRTCKEAWVLVGVLPTGRPRSPKPKQDGASGEEDGLLEFRWPFLKREL